MTTPLPIHIKILIVIATVLFVCMMWSSYQISPETKGPIRLTQSQQDFEDVRTDEHLFDQQGEF